MTPTGFGLSLISENIITEVEEFDLIEKILAEFTATAAAGRVETRPHGGRSRVLRFGYSYDEPHTFSVERPVWISDLTLGRAALRPFDNHESVTINEYREGDGIDSHVDSLAFEERIGVLSLGGQGLLKFDDLGGAFTVPARSFWLIEREARQMRHSLRCTAGPRWSIVFRKLLGHL